MYVCTDSRIEDVDGDVYEVGDEIEVALRPTPAALGTERFLVGKPEEEES